MDPSLPRHSSCSRLAVAVLSAVVVVVVVVVFVVVVDQVIQQTPAYLHSLILIQIFSHKKETMVHIFANLAC